MPKSLSENSKLFKERAFHRKNNHPAALFGSPKVGHIGLSGHRSANVLLTHQRNLGGKLSSSMG